LLSNQFLNGTLLADTGPAVRAGDYSAIALTDTGMVYASSMEGQNYTYDSNSNWGRFIVLRGPSNGLGMAQF
jgi:hypothetical protein